jgi:predicted ester cyclase
MSEVNKSIVITSTEALNARDLSMWSQMRADNFTGEYPGLPVLNKAQSKMFNQSFVTAFPDIHVHAEHILAEGDFVLIHWTASGTHTERLAAVSGETIPPTGRKVTIAGVLLAEVRESKVAREWSYWDQLSLLVQLGVMEQPGLFSPIEGF